MGSDQVRSSIALSTNWCQVKHREPHNSSSLGLELKITLGDGLNMQLGPQAGAEPNTTTSGATKDSSLGKALWGYSKGPGHSAVARPVRPVELGFSRKMLTQAGGRISAWLWILFARCLPPPSFHSPKWAVCCVRAGRDLSPLPVTLTKYLRLGTR